MLKRIFDLVVATTALILLSPLLVAAGLAVALSSPGALLFRQPRVGLRGRPFVIYKFRSMTQRPGGPSGSFDAGDASRVTRVGKVLRASKIDELPQLWNVIKGEMSLVGPRPEVQHWVDAYPQRWALVHAVKPGITDPAAIVYRHEEAILLASADPVATYRHEILPHKLDLYEAYARDQSFRGDLAILWRTAMAVGGRLKKTEKTPCLPQPNQEAP